MWITKLQVTSDNIMLHSTWICNAFHIIPDIYFSLLHFCLQVQNADDNMYLERVEPTLTFILQDKAIIVLNNEVGFSANHIRALCDVGNSTKVGHNAGYIGKKGVGFKSVFRVPLKALLLFASFLSAFHANFKNLDSLNT